MRDRDLLRAEAKLGLRDPWYLSTEIFGNGQDEDFPRPEAECRPPLEFLTRERPKELSPSDKWFDYYSAPRETAKTINALVTLAREIILHPNIAILIMNEEKQQAATSLGVISDWLEREKVVQLYGTFKGKRGWEKEAITSAQRTKARRDPTLACTGIENPIEGMHPDIILWDDLIGDLTANREGFMRAERRIKQCIPVLRTGGRSIYICTRWGVEDPSVKILGQWKEGVMWHAMGNRGFFGAYAIKGDEEFFPHAVVGEPLFESILPRKRLEQLQATMSFSLFSSQYLNEPSPEGGAYFDESDIPRFELYVNA